MKKSRIIVYICAFIFIIIFGCCITNKLDSKTENVNTNSQLSNKKIGWGIKRKNNHQQPDLGSTNKNLLEKYNGISIGNQISKNVYLTFDAGYEAGYTEKILEVLKQNNVKAVFFLKAHFINSKPELVQKMIEDGHTIGNH